MKRETLNCACRECYILVVEEHKNPDGTLGSSGELHLNPDCRSIGTDADGNETSYA